MRDGHPTASRFRHSGCAAAMLLLAFPALAGAQPASGSWREALPARAAHCAVYDPVGHQMVVFGGKEGVQNTILAGSVHGEVWTLSLPQSGPSRWRLRQTLGTAPTPRYGHTGIYDPVRGRMIVFSGWGGSNEVWALSSLSSAPTWTLLAPVGTPPSARQDHCAVYDPVGDRMIVFGGRSLERLNDVWALSLADPPTWTQLAPTGAPPEPRSGASAVYDSQRQRILVFGGDTQDNATWALDLAGSPAWSQLATAGTAPQIRSYHSALYDAPRDRMLIFSGESGGVVLGDCYQLSLAGTPTWQPFGYVPFSRGSVVYDSALDRALAYGGATDTGSATENQTWAIALAGAATMTRLVPSGPGPAGLWDGSAIFDPPRSRVVVFGGSVPGFFEPSFTNNAWGLTVPLWSGPNPPPELVYDWSALGSGTRPDGRYGHTAVRDPAGDRMIVFGGDRFWGSPSVLNDAWSLSLASGAWTQLAPAGTPPAPRLEHSAIYDEPGQRMMVFGGQPVPFFVPPPFSPFGDLWQLDLSVDPPVWSQLAPLGTPPPARSKHTAIVDVDHRRMIVFGGRDAAGALLNDAWALSLTGTPTWTPIAANGTPPSPREEHVAIYEGQTSATRRMLVHGGTSDREVWSLWLGGTEAWTRETVDGPAPDAWSQHLGVVLDDGALPQSERGLLVLGGPSASIWEFVQPTTVAVDDRAENPGLHLIGAWPNPASGALEIAFHLPDAAPARLELFDLAGRRVVVREVGTLGAGRHRVWLPEISSLTPGLYLARLVRGADARTAKVAVIR